MSSYFCSRAVILRDIGDALVNQPLDGWRILYSIVPTVSYVLSGVTSVVVLALGVWLMFEGFGTALALMGVLLLLQDTEIPKRGVRRGIC